MFRLGALLAIVCVATATNITNIDYKILQKLSTLIDTNRTIDLKSIAALNKTLSKELLTKLSGFVNLTRNDTKVADDTEPYDVYESPGKMRPSLVDAIEESPDYASSVVLASDLLSLTSAVANVEDKACREQGYMFLNGLLLNKRWALRMFDASSKSPQGLLFGSSYHLGNFDECVGIQDASDDGVTLEGQYCLATIRWPQPELKKTRTGRGEILRWAVCVPSACDARAVKSFVGDVIARTVGNTTTVEVMERDCYKREPLTVSTLDVTYLSIIMFFVVILTIGTSYEIYCLKWGNMKKTTTHELIVSFSIINNTKKILSTKQNNALGLECISGIKSLSMMLVLASHTSLFVGTGPVMDAEGWDNLLRAPVNGLMLNSMLLVDTFLMLSAFLFSRLLLIELDKRRGKLNVLPILVFRYIRLTPSYLVVLLFYITWFPKIGEGPLWKDKLLLEHERCKESWWTNILYINNYVNADKMCMFQSWYVSVDTQLFFIAPIFIYGLWRWRRAGPIIVGLAVFGSLLVPAVITYVKQYDPTLMIFAKESTDIVSNFYFHEAYVKTHMKMITYFMGLLAGYILHRIQSENYELSRPLKVFGWIINLILGTVTIFSVSIFYQDWYSYNRIEAAAYTSLHRLAWGIANGWLIIACATGNGGIIGKLLTWKLLLPFSRLTFSAYLVNGIVELYAIGQLRHPLHVSYFTLVTTCLSHIALTFVLGMMLCITFESPIHGIEKILLRMFARPVLSDNAIKQQSRESSRNTSQSRMESS